MKKSKEIDKSKGQGVNVIVSASEVNRDGQNGETIGWLKVDDKGCNGAKGRRGQRGNESISIFKDFRNSS